MDSPHPWRGIRPWKRHSLVLMVAGLVYIGIGISYLMAEGTHARSVSLALAFMIMPAKAWGVVWMLCGLMSIISSRWPPISETWGYFVLTGQTAAWSCFYLMGMLFFHAPSTNITGVLTWGLVAFMWWAISGLLNPPALVVVVPTAEDVTSILHDEQARESTVYFGKDVRAEEPASVRED